MDNIIELAIKSMNDNDEMADYQERKKELKVAFNERKYLSKFYLGWSI